MVLENVREARHVHPDPEALFRGVHKIVWRVRSLARFPPPIRFAPPYIKAQAQRFWTLLVALCWSACVVTRKRLQTPNPENSKTQKGTQK